MENGLITFNQKEAVYKSIQEIVNHSELENYFAEGNEILNEQTIIQKEGKTIKPDRMVLAKNKEVFLLDYKTGAPKPQHKQQLAVYENVLVKMGFVVSKKLLVYLGETPNVIHL